MSACHRVTAFIAAVVVAACGAPKDDAGAVPDTGAAQAAGATATVPAVLVGDYHLVEFQSMDDAQGTSRPDDQSKYTMRLAADGTVAMKLDCNNATGTWRAEPGADPNSGTFSFGPLAMTQALCPPQSMGEKIGADAQHVTGYLLQDGHLNLSLMADGGIYRWEPLPQRAM